MVERASRLVLVGGGGHASDVLQGIEAMNATRVRWEVVGILDDGNPARRRFKGRGVTLVGGVDDVAALDASFVLCAGWPAVRRALATRIGDRARACDAIVHPSSELGAGADLGAGSVVLFGAHVSPMVRFGVHALVSYNATVGHDTTFGPFASVMPGANVSGDVVAGAGVLVGSGAVVREGVRLGDGCRVGAGAVVVNDVPEGATVVGVPARVRD